jgi:hypothetical protein
MSSENPNFEESTFNPAALPTEAGLRQEARTDFQLWEEGLSADEIANLRNEVRSLSRKDEEEDD